MCWDSEPKSERWLPLGLLSFGLSDLTTEASEWTLFLPFHSVHRRPSVDCGGRAAWQPATHPCRFPYPIARCCRTCRVRLAGGVTIWFPKESIKIPASVGCLLVLRFVEFSPLFSVGLNACRCIGMCCYVWCCNVSITFSIITLVLLRCWGKNNIAK